MYRVIYQVEHNGKHRTYREVCGLCGRKGPDGTTRGNARTRAHLHGWVLLDVQSIQHAEVGTFGIIHVNACKRCATRLFRDEG